MAQKSPSHSSNAWYWIGKLTPPQVLPSSVSREALLASMKEKACVPLTLLTAPAGYGKTTLLMQWHEVLRQQTPETAVAWLSLDEADGEPNRFLAYLILALDHAGIELAHLPHLAASQALDVQPQRTLHALRQALARENRAITLVLDDYHLAASPEVADILDPLIEQAAPWLRWVVASRTRPHWPLSRWKAKGWVHEVSAMLYLSNFALAFFSLGAWGVWGVWGTWIAELYPTRQRTIGYGWAILAQRVANILAPSVIGMLALLIPETEGKTLE